MPTGTRSPLFFIPRRFYGLFGEYGFVSHSSPQEICCRSIFFRLSSFLPPRVIPFWSVCACVSMGYLENMDLFRILHHNKFTLDPYWPIQVFPPRIIPFWSLSACVFVWPFVFHAMESMHYINLFRRIHHNLQKI